MKISPPAKFDSVRALVVIHLLLALMLPFLFTQFGGCQGQDYIQPVELGPEVSATELDDALSKPLAGTTPTSIQLGEAYVISETQAIADGSAGMVLSDTAQSVIERTENANEILLTVIENKQIYVNGEVRKTTTEIPIRIEKAPPETGPAAMAEKLMFGPVENDHSAESPLRSEVVQLLRDRSPEALLGKLRAAAASKGDVSTADSSVTYHGLKVAVAMEPPPPLVAQQAGCQGIPNCRIEVHRVSFDMVFWDGGRPDRVHWDLVMSPQVPYLASILNKCITGLAGTGENQPKILIKQCIPVVNFRYH